MEMIKAIIKEALGKLEFEVECCIRVSEKINIKELAQPSIDRENGIKDAIVRLKEEYATLLRMEIAVGLIPDIESKKGERL